ncbi:MAG TPA: electron transfer flavoprotein subunit alpha/FixB family protein [bacterium]|nr:electron transfer flavoprotein subunit alpha/FixB family protein [bacterium]HQI49860.1 electron transfer flavoprotein subunit alpha/FixB family protein [bacterium]HQJ65877.1 electron transfer flavoprotein subunit alpha/FixB family protein [bacterium]
MSMILAVAEIQEGHLRKVSREVVTQARLLADAAKGKVTALVIAAPGAAGEAATLGSFGADQVLLAEEERLEAYNGTIYRNLVVAAIKQTSAAVVLFPATSIGRDLSPRVAAATGAALASDCTGLAWQEGGVEVQKPLYAGKVIAEMALSGPLQMVTLRPNLFPAQEVRPGQSAVVVPLVLPDWSSPVALQEVRKRDTSRLDVSDAAIVLTGGRGMRGPEHFKILEEIAGMLDGAVGATRAVVDAGWRPHSEQVGQTGKVVSPDLYLMCGASGSIQHWAGMSGSKCIVAINKDPNAPIMQRADYSVVGDLFEILPLLKEELARLRG